MKKTTIALLAAAMLILALGSAHGEYKLDKEQTGDFALLNEIMVEIETVGKMIQTASEEPAIGTVTVLNMGDIEVRPGDLVMLFALTDGAAEGSTIRWEMLDLTEFTKSTQVTPWQTIGTGDTYRMVAEETLINQCFRAVLCAPDGRETASEPCTVNILTKSELDEVEVPVIPENIDIPEIDDLSSLDEQPLETLPVIDLDEQLRPLRAVVIRAECPSVLQPGDSITLRAVTEGFDSSNPIYRWECDKGDGFRVLEGEQESTYSFTVTAESLTWKWRLTVTDV